MKIPNLVFKNPKIEAGGSRSVLAVEVLGTAPLLMNRFADKSLIQMLKKHMGGDVPREKKNPREIIESATQRNVNGVVAMPSTAFKKSIMTASGGFKAFTGAKRTQLQISLFIHGASIPIEHDEMVPHMAMVRTSGIKRDPDVRFRPSFPNWKARFAVLYDEGTLATEMVIDLISRAGAVGVGEWRPEKRGDFGTYRLSRILDANEGREAMALCEPIIRPIEIPDWALDMDIDMSKIQKILAAQNEDEREEEVGAAE